jgi:4-amino-4-deoxy-L-arabinose transferase
MDLTSIIRTDFTNGQVLWIMALLFSGTASILFFLKRNYSISLLFLLFAGTILRFLAARLDPFLWTWDEQYHALVAKNLMGNPLKPVLITNPVLDYDMTAWKENHIWLHKQPWFLWQIALFFKIFGVSEFVPRWPTALMMALMIPVIYRIGSLAANRNIAWLAAFLYTFSFYFIDLVSGIIPTDHNDAAFLFYVSLSIWSWMEYSLSHKKRWIFLIGFFAGVAILNKWLTGLLVYSGWIVIIFTNTKKSDWKKEIKNLAFSLGITLAVMLPWQIYILTHFPRESIFEYLYNSRHLLSAVEGHRGGVWYHLALLPEQYGGWFVYLLILPGLYFLLKEMRNPGIRLGLLVYLLFSYLFFTLAATKMPMFCTIVSPLIFLALAAIICKILGWMDALLPGRSGQIFCFFFICLVGIYSLDINRLDREHSERNPYWEKLRTNAGIDKVMAKKLPSKDYVVFNGGGHNAVMFMFYSGQVAYGHYPNETEYLSLKKRRVKIATFVDRSIPDFLKTDPTVFKLYVNPTPY